MRNGVKKGCGGGAGILNHRYLELRMEGRQYVEKEMSVRYEGSVFLHLKTT